jgi:hypothetical protein
MILELCDLSQAPSMGGVYKGCPPRSPSSLLVLHFLQVLGNCPVLLVLPKTSGQLRSTCIVPCRCGWASATLLCDGSIFACYLFGLSRLILLFIDSFGFALID